MADENKIIEGVNVVIECNTFTDRTLVRAYELWHQDELDGKCEELKPGERDAERDAEALLEYIKQAKNEAEGSVKPDAPDAERLEDDEAK